MLSSKDFHRPCKYNLDTRNQLWCSVIADSHDSICACETPFAHLLANLFPPGHQDRNKTINEILERDYKELCLSGGDAETRIGMALDSAAAEDPGGIKQEEEEYIKDEELQNIIAAGEDAGTR